MGIGRDSQLSKSTNDLLVDHKTPPNYVFQRNKRPRETEISPSDFTGFKDEIKELITSLIGVQKNDLMQITNSLKDIQQTNLCIETSINLLSTQNEEFRKKIEQLEQQAKKDKEYITILEDKIEDVQRHARKSSIELKNVPRKQHENQDDLINTVTTLARTINLDFCSRDVKDIFRLKGKNERDKDPPIIVELSSTIKRTELLKKVKEFNYKNKTRLQAKHLGFTRNEDSPIYISEQLTAKGARLYFLSRDLVKSNKFKYCWTAFGKILVRKDDNSKIICIQNEAQVHHLLQKD